MQTTPCAKDRGLWIHIVGVPEFVEDSWVLQIQNGFWIERRGCMPCDVLLVRHWHRISRWLRTAIGIRDQEIM